MMMGVLASGCTKSEPKPDNSIKRHATTQEIKECIDSIHQISPFKDIDSIKIEDQGDYQPTFIPSSTEGPVSYTHLDVYKRQDMGGVLRAFRTEADGAERRWRY